MLCQLRTSFSKFYAQQHSGRSLSWCPAWGQCLLRASYGMQTRKEFLVSHFQAVVLLCFNSADTLSFEELEEKTRIPAAELQLTLQSLSFHKAVKLLLRDSAEQYVRPADKFSYNAGFHHKLYRIAVATISAKAWRAASLLFLWFRSQYQKASVNVQVQHGWLHLLALQVMMKITGISFFRAAMFKWLQVHVSSTSCRRLSCCLSGTLCGSFLLWWQEQLQEETAVEQRVIGFEGRLLWLTCSNNA